MIMATPPGKGVRSRKREREVEEASPSVEAVSGKNLKEMASLVLARWRTTAYKDNSVTRKLAEVLIETSPGTEKDFKPQKANGKKSSTSRQILKVDIGREWISKRHQGIGKQVAGDPLER